MNPSGAGEAEMQARLAFRERRNVVRTYMNKWAVHFESGVFLNSCATTISDQHPSHPTRTRVRTLLRQRLDRRFGHIVHRVPGRRGDALFRSGVDDTARILLVCPAPRVPDQRLSDEAGGRTYMMGAKTAVPCRTPR